MNPHSQHEPDDELLSAYLDNELSPDERALVESRLATDPTARQTLEQLRSVSQSLRDLPRKTIAPNLRDTVLERIKAGREIKSGLATSPQPSALGPQPPTFSIGRTRRGWTWAAIAIAAAILIMVFQQDEPSKDLPALAQNDKSPAATDGRIAATDPPLSNSTQSADPADLYTQKREASRPAPREHVSPIEPFGADARTAESESIARSDVASEKQLTMRREELSRRTTSWDLGKPSDTTVIGRSEASNSNSGDIPSPPIMPSAPAAPPVATRSAADVAASTERPPTQEVAVVDVVLNPAAFKSGAFDRILLKNGVATDQAPPARDESRTDNRYSLTTPNSSARSEPLAPEASELEAAPFREGAADAESKRDNVEVILVDAPASTILSCMADLKNDNNNVLGVAVQKTSAIQSEPDSGGKTQREWFRNLYSYERGLSHTDEARASALLQKNIAEQQAREAERPAGELSGGGRASGSPQPSATANPIASNESATRGLARKLQIPSGNIGGMRFHNYADDSQPSAVTDGPSRVEQLQLHQESAKGEDRMQVLFVLRPGENPPPSLKAKNTPE